MYKTNDNQNVRKPIKYKTSINEYEMPNDEIKDVKPNIIKREKAMLN
jgi:hypothetical protein